MKQPKECPYSGDLAKPMPRRKRMGLFDDPVTTPEHEHEILRRFALLFEHYGLPAGPPGTGSSDRWTALAIELAFAHVPGLQEAKQTARRGPPAKKLTPERVAARRMLWKEVEGLKGGARNTASAAAKALKTRWCDEPPGPASPLSVFANMTEHTLRQEIAQARRERETEGLRVVIARGLARLGHIGPPGPVALQDGSDSEVK